MPLIHYRLNFPLSVYLSGGDAIHAHPKYGRFMRESGSVNEFTRVEARVEAEEQLDGLRCLKIKVNRWYYSKDVPVLQYLWLAPERNYLCVKEQLSWPKSMFGDLPMHEMRVDESPRDRAGPLVPDANHRRRLRSRSAASAENRHRQSHRDRRREGRSRPAPRPLVLPDVPIPAGLPVFTIQDADSRRFVTAGADRRRSEGEGKARRVVAKVREQELRYADLEVKARSTTRISDRICMEGIITEQTTERALRPSRGLGLLHGARQLRHARRPAQRAR